MIKLEAQYFVEKFGMLAHPEGGYFKETYRSQEVIEKKSLPVRFAGNRSFSTGIYFLLESHHFSAFHRIQADEMWHFYYGSPLNVFIIDQNGNFSIIKLGQNLENGEVFQAVVPAGSWFASQPSLSQSFSLVGCTVAPGFDFADFELAKANELSLQYPEHELIIQKLCRQ